MNPKQADWQLADARLESTIRGEGSQSELGTGWGTGELAEQWAREVTDNNPALSLELTLPAVLAGLSAAGQGAFWIDLRRPGASPLPTSSVVQSIGVMPSGGGKSTLLDMLRPLVWAADQAGSLWRRHFAEAAQIAAKSSSLLPEPNPLVDKELQAWSRIYHGGLCNSLLVSTGTPEGLRSALVNNSGHRFLMTAEPDVFREISAYTPRGGSVSVYVEGWDQGSILVDRVNQAIHIPEASLPMLVLMQPESFEQYTRPGADGGDQFVTRGLFGRTLLAQAPELDLPEAGHIAFPMAGAETEPEHTPLANELQTVMGWVAVSGSEYRARKGIRAAWDKAFEEGATWLDVVDQPAGVRSALGEAARRRVVPWDPDGPHDAQRGLAAYEQLYRQRGRLSYLVEQIKKVDPVRAEVYRPFVSRYLAHALRIAWWMSAAARPDLVYQPSLKDAVAGLKVPPAAIVPEALEDVGLRIMPWLTERWSAVMDARTEAHRRIQFAGSVLANPRGLVLDLESRILQIALKVTVHAFAVDPKKAEAVLTARLAAGEPGEKFTASQIHQAIRRTSRDFRAVPSDTVRRILDQFCLESTPPLVEKATVSGTGAAASHSYRLTNVGLREAQKLE